MKTWWLKAGLTGLLLLALSACGGTDTPDNTPSPGEGPATALTQQEAEEFVGVALSANEFILEPFLGLGAGGSGPFGLTTPNLLNDLGLQTSELSVQQEDCTTLTGNDTDADNDGIPVDVTLTADCDEVFESGRFIFRASVRIQDKDDSSPLSGYSLVYDDYEITVSADGQTATIKLDMNFDLTIGNGTYRADYDYDLSITSPDVSGRIAFDYTVTYTPDNAADPFEAGTFAFDGSLQYSSEGESYSMTTSSAGLHYSAVCGDFDSGSAQYADSAGNTVTLTYNSCGSVTATYNGSPLP